MRRAENAENGVVQRYLLETAVQRAVSRLRRTNDRSVLLVHEDHEDDENAENGVVQQSLKSFFTFLRGVCDELFEFFVGVSPKPSLSAITTL
jgi:hypothetical protein